MTTLSDRYEVLGLLATGGMASVLYGRLRGPAGFAREVAIKRLHPHFAREPEFLSMFVDEAHICARLSHANIVSALDVIDTPPDLCLVMEYVPGAGLDVLVHAARSRELAVPVPVAVALVAGVLHGLHAAHEARGEHGEPLDIVHRDVSPSNVLVGEDGIPRVLDFGIAKAVSKLRTTPSGEIKGKLPYTAPELLRGHDIDRRFDVYSAAVVLWELLAGKSLFSRQPSASIIQEVLERELPLPSSERAEVSAELDALVMRGLARDPTLRFETAGAFAQALERACDVARQSEVSAWVRSLSGELLDQRAADLRRLGREFTASRQTLIKPAEPARDALDVPTIVHEPAIVRAPSQLPVPPRRSAMGWLIGALAVVVLGGVLHAGAAQKKPLPEVQTPATQVEAVRSEVAPPLWSTNTVEPAAPAVVLEPAPVEPSVELDKTSNTVRTRRARPRAEAAITDAVAVDCTQAFQLERIDGVVVKTFKPGCLK